MLSQHWWWQQTRGKYYKNWNDFIIDNAEKRYISIEVFFFLEWENNNSILIKSYLLNGSIFNKERRP